MQPKASHSATHHSTAQPNVIAARSAPTRATQLVRSSKVARQVGPARTQTHQCGRVETRDGQPTDASYDLHRHYLSFAFICFDTLSIVIGQVK